MDLKAAEMFIAVVRAGSLSAASLKMRVPLATLSRNVRQLEEELAVQLLERSARGTKLTDAGMLLYEHASRGIDALHEGELAVTSHRHVLKGRLRLSIPPSFEPWWELLAAFQREHPDIQVVVYTTERAVDLSMEGIDIALRIGPVVHESLVAKRLLRYRHILVASPALVERFGMPTSPDALFALPAGIWVRDANAHRPWRLGEREIEPTPILAVNDYLHLRQRAIQGDIVTELPPFLAAEALRDGRLVALLVNHPFPEQEVSLLYQRQQQPSRVVRAYLDYCQRAVGRYLGGA
ncbi:MAG: LysR substrate-binding domain-containing protein [Thermoleophilia bacterium]|nr:LysR substrate-binding domain-containing protein [Thermoleophilia bacterium]